jgi:hypothetical protein
LTAGGHKQRTGKQGTKGLHKQPTADTEQKLLKKILEIRQHAGNTRNAVAVSARLKPKRRRYRALRDALDLRGAKFRRLVHDPIIQAIDLGGPALFF